ncbi:unnamed protein product [Phaeothamnion confervicola]
MADADGERITLLHRDGHGIGSTHFRRLTAALSLLAFSAIALTGYMYMQAQAVANDMNFKGAKKGKPGAALVPDVIDKVHDKVALRVRFDKHFTVADGTELDQNMTAIEPDVLLEGTKKKALYTLIMSDPDAPTPQNPTHREYLHWLVTNIPASRAKAAAGDLVVGYVGPAPPEGRHRYGLTVWLQHKDRPVMVETSPLRPGFKTRAFAAAHELEGPVGALVFYVPHTEEAGEEEEAAPPEVGGEDEATAAEAEAAAAGAEAAAAEAPAATVDAGEAAAAPEAGETAAASEAEEAGPSEPEEAGPSETQEATPEQ